MSKLLELQYNWKVQSHTQEPHKETIHNFFIPTTAHSFTSTNSFEIQIRKHRLISISKELVLKNEVGRAYYHTWEERIAQGMRSDHRNCGVTRREMPLK